MRQLPLLYEALGARQRALTRHLFNPDVRLIDIGWKIKQSEKRIERGTLCVRVHKRSKPRGVALERFRDEHPERYVDPRDIGFPMDIVEAPYRLHASFGFAMPQAPAPSSSSPVIMMRRPRRCVPAPRGLPSIGRPPSRF